MTWICSLLVLVPLLGAPSAVPGSPFGPSLAQEHSGTPVRSHEPDGSEALKAQVREAEQQRLTAMTTADLDTLETLLDDCLSYGHSNGTMDTKDSLLEALRSGNIRYEAIQPSEMHVRLRGPDVALVTARADFKVALPERILEVDLRYTVTWNLTSGRWRMVEYQSTRAGD